MSTLRVRTEDKNIRRHPHHEQRGKMKTGCLLIKGEPPDYKQYLKFTKNIAPLKKRQK
jgi:hypothetical protein